MYSISEVCQHIKPSILESCSLIDLDFFIRLCKAFNTEIRLHVPGDSERPPHSLPNYLRVFISEVARLDSILVDGLWTGLQELIWDTKYYPRSSLTEIEKARIDEVGVRLATTTKSRHKLASTMFYPPNRECLHCQGDLKTPSRIQVTLFSAQTGLNARQGYSTSFSCDACKIRYYHNYYTLNDNRYYYNSTIPTYIQIEDHAFVEAELCEFYTSLMLFAWVSSQNCANIHNAATKRAANNSSKHSTISSEQVFRAFILNGLLRECAEEKSILILPEKGDHNSRLKSAMELRTMKIIEHGHKEKMHACNKCEVLIDGPGHMGLRSLRACVTDGITLGRPCCKVHNCSQPLPTNRAHYCIDLRTNGPCELELEYHGRDGELQEQYSLVVSTGDVT